VNKLLQLLQANKGSGVLDIVNSADETTIYIYDAIVSDDYFGGVSAETFVKALKGIDSPTINIRINSPGGDVFAARAIEQAIREHPAKVIAHIDGFAASAASYVALAADEVLMAEGAFYMIHKAWTIAFGNSEDLLQTADLLDKIDESLVNTYAKATGQEPDKIRQWMADETWFSAKEAVDLGFASAISGSKAKNTTNWDLSAYSHAPNIEKENKIADNKEEEAQALLASQALQADFDHRRRQLQMVEMDG
jgi:ATP-dependent Clp protease protease subunit